MTALTMMMVVAFAQSGSDADLVEKLRSQLTVGSVSLSDYEALVQAEVSLPEERQQEWLVMRGFYAWSLALRKPTKELESQAVEEAKRCLASAREMGAVDLNRICPGDCWDAVPLAARVYWNELSTPARSEGPLQQMSVAAHQQKTEQAMAIASADSQLVEMENRRNQAKKEVQSFLELIASRQKLLADLDTQLQARQNQLKAIQTEVESLSATLLGLQRQIADTRTALASLQQERQAIELRVPVVRTGAQPDHVTSDQRYTIREGQLFAIGRVTVKMRDHHDGKDGATFAVGERKIRLTPIQHLEIDNHFYLRLIRYGLPQASAEVEIVEFNR